MVDMNCFYKASQKRFSTKRNILKSFASIFDPLGILSPIVTKFKILFHEICQKILHWDEMLSDVLLRQWKKLEMSFKYPLSIRRFLFSKSFNVKISRVTRVL